MSKENEETEETEETEKKAPPSKAEIKALFEEYEKAYDECEVAEVEFKEKQIEKQASVKKIYDTIGSKGPFEWKGKKLTITRRGETYFFKGETSSKVMKID